jgi:hypothetical protein
MKTVKTKGSVTFENIVFVCGSKQLSFDDFKTSILDKNKVSPWILKGVEKRSVKIMEDAGVTYWLIYDKDQSLLKLLSTFKKEGKMQQEVVSKIPAVLSDYLKANDLCPIKKESGKFTFQKEVDVLVKVKSPEEVKEEETAEDKKKKKRVSDYLKLLLDKDRTACDEDSPCDHDKMCDMESKKCMKKTFTKYEPYGKDTEVFEHNGHTYIGKKDTIAKLKEKLSKSKEVDSDVESEAEPEVESEDEEVSLHLDEDIDIENLTALQKELYECLMKGGASA